VAGRLVFHQHVSCSGVGRDPQRVPLLQVPPGSARLSALGCRCLFGGHRATAGPGSGWGSGQLLV